MEMNDTPNRAEDFMDSDMLHLWQLMEPMPGDLRLYGGTAIALYLGHRHSTDFDFATPQTVIDKEFVSKLPFMQKAREVMGGRGMIDAVIEGENRDIKITFMECGHLIPMPSQSSIRASNGVLVAHPIDLIVTKIEACFDREQVRDYEDISFAVEAWPDWCRTACDLVLKDRRLDSICGILSSPPYNVYQDLNSERLKIIRTFAQDLLKEKIQVNEIELDL